MSGWSSVPLGSVAKIERRVVEPGQIQRGSHFVGLEHIEKGGAILSTLQVEKGDLASAKFAFGPEHVLFGKLRPNLAKVARPSFAGICSTDILPLRPGKSLDRDFLAHFLLTPTSVALAVSLATGANLPRLSPGALAEFLLPLPPLPEQRRIAEILDKADALRAKRRAALNSLPGLSTQLFLSLFGDPSHNPRSWPEETLGRVLASGPQNGLYKPSSDYGTGTPILRIDGFYDGEITDLNSLKRVRVSAEEQALYRLREGDIIVNRVNSMEYLGKSALVPALEEPTVFESNMMRLAVDTTRVLPGFLIHYLQMSRARAHILKSAKAAVNQASINQQDVKALPLLLPPLDLQSAFLEQHRALQHLRASHRASLASLDSLFASLQHLAFSGDL